MTYLGEICDEDNKVGGLGLSSGYTVGDDQRADKESNGLEEV